MKRRGRKTGIPSYRHYKRTGQAIVCIDGRYFYLGPYGTTQSRAEYDKLIAEWLANGRNLLPSSDENGRVTIVELIAAYWRHATTWYVKNGQPTKDQYKIRQTLDLLMNMYGDVGAYDFGPLKLKAVRQRMIDLKWSRRYVNEQIDRIKRMFRWGVENEFTPTTVAQALTAVAGLRWGTP